MNDLKELAAMTALNNTLRSSYFDICAVDKVAKLLDVNPRGEAYDMLHALHCIHYDKMPPQLCEAIPDLIKQCLGREITYQFQHLKQEVIEVTPASRLMKAIGLAK